MLENEMLMGGKENGLDFGEEEGEHGESPGKEDKKDATATKASVSAMAKAKAAQ